MHQLVHSSITHRVFATISRSRLDKAAAGSRVAVPPRQRRGVWLRFAELDGVAGLWRAHLRGGPRGHAGHLRPVSHPLDKAAASEERGSVQSTDYRLGT